MLSILEIDFTDISLTASIVNTGIAKGIRAGYYFAGNITEGFFGCEKERPI